MNNLLTLDLLHMDGNSGVRLCGVHLKTFGMQISIVLTITSGMVGVDENVYNNTVHSQYLKHINYFILKPTIC